jgi:NAD(P)-dependent dehydrogenase (short-subunit alcohol dehydrogenase family)
MGMLEGKVAIVTGSSSGIGRAIAVRYAREGASVVLADVRDAPVEGGPSTLQVIEDADGTALDVKADVSAWHDVDRLIASAVERFGRLDIMVNNAAVYTSTNLLQTSEAQWDFVAGVNLRGMFFGCKRAVQQMLTQEPVDEVRGRIVNVSSQHGMIASPGDFPYGVTKGGTVQMTRQIAVDHAQDLIVCNAVAPGKIITGKPGAAIDPKALDYSRSRTPWPRLGRPEDVAGAAVFLGSNLATYVSGINLMVDGGWMAG